MLASPVDAIIIGAGAAGIGAAATLRAGGVDNYIVLEATHRTGGRVKALTLGSENPVQVENGANWVSGAGEAPYWPHRAVNPLFAIATKLNTSMVRVPGSATNMSNWAVVGEDGGWADSNRSRRDLANAVSRCVGRRGSAAGPKLTAAQAAAACGWVAKDGVDNSLEWQLFTGETGLPPQRMSASGYLPDPTYDDFGPDDYFVDDQRPRGLAQLLDAVADGALDGGARAFDGGRLVLNAHVARIEYTCEGVQVTTADGRSYRGQYAISTLPLGVLHRRAAEIFSPRMPPRQATALRAIPMANYTKLFAQWARPWWNTSVYKWAQANDGFNGGELGSVRNLAHPSVLPKSNALLFDLGDPQSSVWEGLSDADATARLLRRLRATHPNVSIPPPTAFHITRHSRDPLTYGAYSAWGNSTVAVHTAAAAPLAAAPATADPATGGAAAAAPSAAPRACAPRVWLSGEAFCPNYNGFMHGGLLAGRRDARRVLAALGRPLDATRTLLPGEESAFGCNHQSTRLTAQRG